MKSELGSLQMPTDTRFIWAAFNLKMTIHLDADTGIMMPRLMSFDANRF